MQRRRCLSLRDRQTDGHACVIDVHREIGRSFVSACRATRPTPTISRPDERGRRRRQISTGAWRRRIHRPIDLGREPVSRVRTCCRTRTPPTASSRDCLYTANNARSTAGLTSEGLGGRTDGGGGGGSYCCNSYESVPHCHCWQVCELLN